MIPVQIRFTKKIIEQIDRLVEEGVYSNRSEAIRDATRRLVIGSNTQEFANLGVAVNRTPEILKREMNAK